MVYHVTEFNGERVERGFLGNERRGIGGFFQGFDEILLESVGELGRIVMESEGIDVVDDAVV